MKARRRTFSDMSILDNEVTTPKVLLQHPPGESLKQRNNKKLNEKLDMVQNNIQKAIEHTRVHHENIVELTIMIMKEVQNVPISGIDKKTYVLELICFFIDKSCASHPVHSKKKCYYDEYLPIVRDVLPRMIDTFVQIDKRKLIIQKKSRKGCC